MNTKFKKALGLTVAVVGVSLLAMEPAFAEASRGSATDTGGLSHVSNQLKNTTNSVADIFSMIAYVVGVGFGIKAALKFKESNENKGQTPISQPITLLVVAAGLLSLPSLLKIGQESIFGTGSSTTSIGGDALRNVN